MWAQRLRVLCSDTSKSLGACHLTHRNNNQPTLGTRKVCSIPHTRTGSSEGRTCTDAFGNPLKNMYFPWENVHIQTHAQLCTNPSVCVEPPDNHSKQLHLNIFKNVIYFPGKGSVEKRGFKCLSYKNTFVVGVYTVTQTDCLVWGILCLCSFLSFLLFFFF